MRLSQVGMGKTMVVTCCVLAEPAKELKSIKDKDFDRWLTMVRKPVEQRLDDDGNEVDDDANDYADETEPTLCFGVTVIVVNNTLVQQWADELQKFAPSLEVYKFYASAANKEAALRHLRTADVLLTTPHMIGYVSGLPKRMLRHMRVHRLVVDESHLIAAKGGGQVRSRLNLIRSPRTWLVSGTPFSTSLDQLEAQAALLGCSTDGQGDLRKLGLGHGFYTHDRPEYVSNEAIVDWLRTRMIRHTKKMRIGGDVALALPEADCRTVWLDMSEDERLLYGLHECASGHTMRIDEPTAQAGGRPRRPTGGSDQTKRGLRYAAAAHVYDEDVVVGNPTVVVSFMGGPYSLQRPSTQGKFEEAVAAYKRTYDTVSVGVAAKPGHAQATARCSKASLSKYAALLDDLVRLREEEPSFRAVIFTRFDIVQRRLVQILKTEATTSGGRLAVDPTGMSKAQLRASELKLYEFNKATPPTARHRRISEFQNAPSPNPRVFIVTYATAAVGITLTAATRVYLMEPCPDPAQEVQAAGRIHRLGQTRDIFIVRYAFRDSIEAATCALHDKIKSGEIVVRDGKFPPRAHELFKQFGPAGKLFQRVADASPHDSSGTGLIDWEGATQAPRRKPGVAPKLSGWTRQCFEEECTLCGARRLAPGSSTWRGTGIYSYLNDEPYHHADPPVVGSGVGVFGVVPRPPDQWMPERFASRGFLGLINTRAEKEAALDKLEEEERRNPASAGAASAAGGDEEGGEDGGGVAGGGAAGSSSAAEFDVMLSDSGEDYAANDSEDCSEGETEGLASDDHWEQLTELAGIDQHGRPSGSPSGVFPSWHPLYSRALPKLFGVARDVAAKNVCDFARAMFDEDSVEKAKRLRRGAKCAPPPSVEELAADADDESEAEQSEEDVGDPAKQLYESFFAEVVAEGDADADLGDVGAAADADEFYGGRQATRSSAHVRRWSSDDSDGDGYGYSDGEGYGSGYSDEDDGYMW